ncbi:peptidyl-tRNA hydrolase [Clavulina sp. PMI_390]|nr:peptidyl-tRNA hydrolase [Clavulina sp. PMI_390]
MNNRASFLIIGLGNYTYPKTRHSVGQLLLESFAARLGVTLREERNLLSWAAQKEIEIELPKPPKSKKQKRQPKPDATTTSEAESSNTSSTLSTLPPSPPPAPKHLAPLRVNVVLAKPKLLMNVSGKAAHLAYKNYIRPMDPSRVIVLHDSLSHKPYSIHPRIGGSANGHNGVTSLISSLQGPNFHRIRIGIGRPPNQGRYQNYVLEKLSQEEIDWWGECGEGVEVAWKAVEAIIMKEMLSASNTPQ